MSSGKRWWLVMAGASRLDARALWRTAALLALVTLTALTSIAAANQRRALIIGNNNYVNVPKLRNARADAEAMDRTLRDLGFKVDLKLDLDERGLRTAVRGFIASLAGGDEAVVYYAGHGVQIGAANYLLPVDIKPIDEIQVQDESLPLQRVLDDLTAQRVRFSVVIIDACRDNPLPKVAGRSVGSTRGLASTTPATGQMVIFSAGAGQSALDSLGPTDRNRNGVFTRVLLERIRDPGVPVDQVLRNVREEVVAMAGSVGHQQVPALYDQVIGRFYFNPAAPSSASAAPAASASTVSGAASASGATPSPGAAPSSGTASASGTTPASGATAPAKPATPKANDSGSTVAGVIAVLGAAAAIAALSKSKRDQNARSGDSSSDYSPAADNIGGNLDSAASGGDFDFQTAQNTGCPEDPQAFWSNCTGTLRYDSGDSYEGIWFANKRHGAGTYRFADGSMYSGQYVENDPSGRGTYYWSASGDRYVGEFRAGRFHGRGILYNSAGQAANSGEWRDDKLVNEFRIDPTEFPADSHLTLP